MQPQNRRSSERRSCWLRLLDDEGRSLGEIANISDGGLLLETDIDLRSTPLIAGSFQLPASAESLSFSAAITWRTPAAAVSNKALAGLRFAELSTTSRKRLQEYLATPRVNDLLKGFQKAGLVSEENLKPLGDVAEIRRLLEAAKSQGSAVRIFCCNGDVGVLPAILDIDPGTLSFDIGDYRTDAIKGFDPVFVEFSVGERKFYFEATTKDSNACALKTTVPDMLFFSERRVEARRAAKTPGTRFLTAVRANNDEISGEVIDLNSSGLAFKVRETMPYRLMTGEVLNNIATSGVPAVCSSATIVYVAAEKSDEEAWRVGIKFDVVRMPCEYQRLEFTKGYRQPPLRTLPAQEAGLDEPGINVVRYYNERDEELVAIVNSTTELGRVVEMPVVVIPPALGRRKETLGLLALTIVENFKKCGKDVAVIRYDGIRTVGESYNDRECRSPGREMLNFTMSQSIEDLLTTLDFLEGRAPIRCTNVIVLAFSMVSIIARRAIIRDTKRRIGLCINVMGSTDVEDFLFNATGGLDHLRDYRDGLRNGAFQVLGCLMKRPMLGDILDNEMAYIQSARQDMAKVDIPVAWICGTYDYWTNKKRIEDIMSVASPSTRVLYEVPTGHIVKTSDEAMQVFDLIVRIMWRHLFQSNITPVYPDAYLAKKANAAEWERVKRTGIDSKTYWKQYLLDKDEGKVGYDVLTFADDYSEFLDRQIALLQLEGADTVADIGGGTGSFLKSYLEKNGETGCAVATRPVRKILIVDLVWEALCKAKAKHRQLAQTASRLGVGVSYVVADTDIESPKVAIPVKSGTCSRILASLLISYLKNPQTFVDECYRILQPGGLMVMSSLKPDADMSKPITQLIEKIKSSADYISDTSLSKEDFLASAQSFMNLAASLFDLEEEMVFKFYTAEELQTLAERAGFQDIEVYGSFGDPPQALIAVARKRSSL